MLKKLLVMQETRVQSLDQEDPLEKEIAIHFNILAWEIPWDREPGGLQSMRLQRVRHDCATNTHTMSKWGKLAKIYKENSPPLFKEIWLLLKVHSFHTPLSSTSCKP